MTDSTPAATPTVIVSRRVRPGAEADFERWNERIRSAAQEFRGYLGSEVQPPSDAHPDEWVTVYRFASVSDLDAWLGSERRARLMVEGERLLDSPARQQRVVEPAAGSSAVTAVMTQRVRPDAAAEFRRAHARFTRAMEQFDGFLRSELLEPVPGVQDEHVIVFSFASKAHLNRWLESRQRRELLSGVAPLIEGERTLNVVGGFAGWFPPAGDRPPVRWKQAVAVLLALVPVSLSLGALQRWLLPDIAWVPTVIVNNIIGVSLLTWALMPLVTRVLAGWLRR